MTASADLYAALAPYYDLEVGDFDADIAMYRNFAARAPGPVLELGVGTGRVALALADDGRELVGIDSSEAMLAIAAERCAAAGAKVELHHADMRSFDLGRSFELIICALGSFRHLLTRADHIAALHRIAKHLAPGGQFVIDLPSWHSVEWEQRPPAVLYDWTRKEAVTGVTITKFNVLRADPATQIQHLTLIFDAQDAGGAVRRTTVEAPLYTFTRPELELLLDAAGLRATHWYGSYDLDPYDASSQEMIAVAELAS